MNILDCESIDTIYASFEAILGIKRINIENTFRNHDIDLFYKENPCHELEADDLVFQVVTNKSMPVPVFNKICWFHLTRASEDNTFEQGILPLGKCIDSIWDFLHRMASEYISEKEWDRFRHTLHDNSHYAHLYTMKANNAFFWGPYGFLIKDIAFRADEVGNHDYLRTPEIVEDICMCFKDTYDINLLDIFKQNTRPCIILKKA